MSEAPSQVEGEPIGRALAHAFDIAGSMDARAYRRAVTLAPAARGRSGTFATTAEALGQDLQRIDARLAVARAAVPPQAGQVADLEQLRAVTAQAQSVFQALGAAHSGSAEDHAGEVLVRLAQLETTLAETDPNLLGTDNHRALQLGARELATVVGGFGEMRSQGQAGALDTFVARTYRRLQQIETGQRRRGNEPASVGGALQTYRNDRSDARVFAGRFARVQQRLQNNEFANRQEVETAMLAAVPGTSNRFQEGVRLLAQARWQSHRASQQAEFGQEHLARAVHATEQAFTQLQSAEADLGMAAQQSELSQHFLSQSDPASARAAVSYADQMRSRAETALAAHDRHLAAGQTDRRAAQAHLRLAVSYLRMSERTLDLVDAGGYGQLVDQESGRTRAQNAQLAQQVQSHTQGTIDLGVQQTRLHAAREDLTRWSTQIGQAVTQLQGATTLLEVETAVDAHVGTGANRAHELIAASLDGVPLSSEAQAFLRDPSSVDPDDVADIREELTEVFRSRPEIARTVAGHILEMRARFETERAALVQTHGEQSATVRAFDTLEHGYLQAWMEKDALVVQALLSAPTSAVSARAVGSLQAWMSEARGRYSQRLLLDPERATAASGQFHTWMQEQPELSSRFQEVRDDYGAPASTVPMTLHLEGTGQLISFNAYVFRDGSEYKAFNPLDGRVYSASTEAGAIDRLAAEAQLGQGTLRYARDGQVRSAQSEPPPEGSLAADIGMGAVGVVGGILLFAPEPTTLTKWGGGAMIAASSAYFGTKGTLAMLDLIEHETFGNNAQTWGAALDIASGALMFLRGAGALASLARTESQIAVHLTRIGRSANLGRAELATMGGGVGLAAHGLAQIYRDTSLSDREKVTQASTMLAAFAIPVGLVAGHRALARAGQSRATRAQVDEAHGRYMRQLDDAEGLARRIARTDSPEVKAQLRRSLDDVVSQARALYDTPAMRARPDLRQAALRTIDRLDAVRTSLPEAPVSRAPRPADADSSHHVSEMDGFRETVGWAGEPTATPPSSAPHRATVHRGMERMPEAMRTRLSGLIDRATRGSAESNDRIAQLNMEQGRLYYELAEAQRLGNEGEVARISQRLEAIPGLQAHAQVLRARQMRSDRGRAVRQMVEFQQSLMSPEGPARARANQLTMDDSVQNPQAVRDAATTFFRLTGDLVDPASINVTQTRTRGLATREGRLDVGRGSAGTVMHELGHHGEWANGAIHQSAVAWREARARQAHGEVRTRSLNDLTSSESFAAGEVAVEDHFSREYVGRRYADATTEVFTMGIENFQSPQRMLDFYIADPEHFFLTVGMLQPTPPTP